MNLISILLISVSGHSFEVVPQSIRCVSLNRKEKYQEISLAQVSPAKYRTQLTLLGDDYKLSRVKLSDSRLYNLRNEVYNINSQDLVIEFNIVSKDEPTQTPRIHLMKQGVRLKNWLCKGYF